MGKKIEDKEQWRSTVRDEIMKESMAHSGDPRHGYFGYIPSLAIGDDSLDKRVKPRKKDPNTGEDGGGPKNFLPSRAKKGHTPDCFFSFHTPLAVGDPFVDNHRRSQRSKAAAIDPEQKFRPGGTVRFSTNKLGYEYQPQGAPARDMRALKEFLKEHSGPKNIVTSPPKKGGRGILTPGVLFTPVAEHLGDDFDAMRKKRVAEQNEHKKILMQRGDIPPFRSTICGGKTFTRDTDIYRHDQPCGVPRDPVKFEGKGLVAHDRPFIPNNPPRKGFNSTLNPFPEHKPNPPPTNTVAHKGDSKDAPPAWRPNHTMDYANPMPSVVLNNRNLRTDHPKSFVRPVI